MYNDLEGYEGFILRLYKLPVTKRVRLKTWTTLEVVQVFSRTLVINKN